MARLELCALALLVACGLADPIRRALLEQNELLIPQRQVDISVLYYRIHEPFHDEKYIEIAKNWDIEKNIDAYNNGTAVRKYVTLLKYGLMLPRAVPFAVLNRIHKFEAVTLFNVLYSANDYDIFFKTAVHLRERVNEQLYIYVLSTVILQRDDTQGIAIPPLYEVFPSFFNNGEIMTTAQRITTHGFRMIEHYPSIYKWDDSVVIMSNATTWPYNGDSTPISYFTHDHGLNALYYNYFLLFPYWLGGDVVPLIKEDRGEWFWYRHKQLLARYYMERLSNGLGEIPELNTKLFEEGYTSGLMYHNGISYPMRSNYFLVDEHDFAVKAITEYELRVRDAIDKGYIITSSGVRVDLRTPKAIDLLGRMIEGGVDSPNANYFKDFIGIWKSLLGNSYLQEKEYVDNYVPLVVPSVLEHYQTALRDPAFYSIWKRVLNLFTLWQQYLPRYQPKELALPSVAIEKVEVDKLVTYFENTYVNVSNHLHTKDTSKGTYDDVSVLVQRPRLNHKVFKVRIHVKNEEAKSVIVRFYLAPKYDSNGHEIPLHINSENFFLMDAFHKFLPAGESVITRDSLENQLTSKDWEKAYDVFLKAEQAVASGGKLDIDKSQDLDKFPHRLLLPKGRVGGMPFVFLIFITEYKKPRDENDEFDPNIELGLGAGSLRWNMDRLGFPFDRPLNFWQIQGLRNFHFEDVLIHHKHTPEIVVPHME